MLLVCIAGLVRLAMMAMIAMAQNLTVTTQDPRMQFTGDWTIQGSGYWEFTTQIGASVSLIFPGTFALFNFLILFSDSAWQGLQSIGTQPKTRVVESRMSLSITISEPSSTSPITRIQPRILYPRYSSHNLGCRLGRTILSMLHSLRLGS